MDKERSFNERPKVGVGVIVFKNGKILLGKRKGELAPGKYAATGGHLEYLESPRECARRETREEAGIEIENVRFLSVINIILDGIHYVHIGFAADWKSGEPQLLEPDKCEGWEWYTLDALPSPLL